MTDRQDHPRTEAGRRLLRDIDRMLIALQGHTVPMTILTDAILAIEAEAAAGPRDEGLREAFEAGWLARDKAQPHVGSPRGYAAEPVDPRHSHDASCCASRGCHPICSHLCGTDLHTCDGTPHD